MFNKNLRKQWQTFVKKVVEAHHSCAIFEIQVHKQNPLVVDSSKDQRWNDEWDKHTSV